MLPESNAEEIRREFGKAEAGLCRGLYAMIRTSFRHSRAVEGNTGKFQIRVLL